jgi:hypothetical protein
MFHIMAGGIIDAKIPQRSIRANQPSKWLGKKRYTKKNIAIVLMMWFIL